MPAHLEYPNLTLPQLLDQTVQRFPERVATVFHGKKLHYWQLKHQVDAFAGGLLALGIHPGDRVALLLPNLPQFVVAFYGALRVGAIVVPTNPLYTQRELEYQLADAGATVIVTLDQFFGRVQAALPSTAIRIAIVAGVGAALPRHLRPLLALKQRRLGVRVIPRGGIVHRFEDVLARPSQLNPISTSPDDLAVLQYTGGTTGTSKGAMLSHRNLVANAIQAYHWQGNLHADQARMLCAAPFFHVYGLTIGMNLTILSGATMLLLARFVPKEVAKVAKRYRPQLFPGVPTMYAALAQLPEVSERHFGSLQICISGAAPLPAEVQEAFQKVSHTRLVEGYGLTEASPVTHCNPVSRPSRSGSIGVPFPDTDALITNPDTWEPIPPGEVGELTVSGPQIMQGYWNRPEETQ